MNHVMTVYGTRPEAIKMAPLVTALRGDPRFTASVVVTGQHRDMLDQVNELFGIDPEHDLDLCRPGHTLQSITAEALRALVPLIERRRPDAVVVQGDTTTAFVAALAAFYVRVPVVHLEAGLRTHDAYSPYPEEMNRRLIAALAALHLAPTAANRDNLVNEGVPASRVHVTGNTGIDALLTVAARPAPYHCANLRALAADPRRRILVTTHRRESWGEPMRRIGAAVAELAQSEPDIVFVLPLHRNPVVSETLRPLVGHLSNVHVTEPLGYRDTVRAMSESYLLLTDSGGMQEEGPALGKPVLVLRDTTERTETLATGAAHLVGTSARRITESVRWLLRDEIAYHHMATAGSPYGDGAATPRCLNAISTLLTDPPTAAAPPNPSLTALPSTTGIGHP